MKRKGSIGRSGSTRSPSATSGTNEKSNSNSNSNTSIFTSISTFQSIFTMRRFSFPRHCIGSSIVFALTLCLLRLIDERSYTNDVKYTYAVINGYDSPSANFVPESKNSECPIQPAIVPKHKVNPTFLASYPGSGSKISWQMAQALTGLVTTDDVLSNGVRNAVAVKTHYPCPEGKEARGSEAINRVVLFFRHPMHALTSYHDFIFAIAHDLNPGESHAPLEHWIAWRDANFENEITTWRKHFEYWMDRYSAQHRLIVPYDKFVLEKYGPDMAERMAEFFSRSDGVTTVPPEQIPCIWRSIIYSSMGTNGLRRRRARMLRATETRNSHFYPSRDEGQQQQQQQLQLQLQLQQHRRLQLEEPPQQVETRKVPNNNIMGSMPQVETYSRPFAQSQMKEIVINLAQLLEKYRDDKVVAPILVEFIDQVTGENAKAT